MIITRFPNAYYILYNKTLNKPTLFRLSGVEYGRRGAWESDLQSRAISTAQHTTAP